ncbi:hypothetical protein BGZ60DRAFT_520214 [Tricladium varicosporioides]|nr:hypothetical protein BGZ60DRAFT_520214 [Hymenoscyphus varicosporioides]
MLQNCIIIGGGVAGITTALSLSKIGMACIIYELRATPATTGGAVNLTPNALRLLEHLEVEVHGCRVDSIEIFSLYTGKRLGEVAFRKYGSSLRILREELLQSLLTAAAKKGIPIVYDSKLISIKDDAREAKVVAIFANGNETQGDFILGCDGVHSAVRTEYVEPERAPIYTDVAVAYSVIDGNGIKSHFQSTSMNSGRFGSLLASYVDPDRTRIYVSGVMSSPQENGKQGWKVRGTDHQKTIAEIDRRYKNSAIPCIDELVERVEEYIFYPVYKLGPYGTWSRGRVLLLGDAAHGMPPQGESTGLAIEDGVLFARILDSFPNMPIPEAFQTYKKTRQPRIDAAYKEAVSRWEHVKDRSWLMQKIIEWLMWVILWYKVEFFGASIGFDVREQEIIH